MATATTADQVLIGKLSLPRANGQMSLFDLPKSFSWLRFFSAEEIASFFAEMLSALGEGQDKGDWTQVGEVLESWKATAEIHADPDVAANFERGLQDLEAGEAVSWENLRGELDLRVGEKSGQRLGDALAALGPWQGETMEVLTERLREARQTEG